MTKNHAMSRPLIIREAIAGDEFAIDNVSKRAIAELRKIYRPTEHAIAQKKATEKSSTRLVAIRDKAVVGTVQYHLVDDSVRVMALAVRPDCRRQGIARALIVALEGIARNVGVKRLSLYTVEQTGNVATFEKLGFRKVHAEDSVLFESDVHEQITEAYLEKTVRG